MGAVFSFFPGFILGSISTITAYTLFLKEQSEEQEQEGQLKFNDEVHHASLRGQKSADHMNGLDHVNFLSDIVLQLWRHINPAGGAAIVESVEPMFKDLLPGPLKTLHFEKCDLGHVPFRFDNIAVHQHNGDNVQFDLDVIWDGKCDIKLKADMGIKLGVKNIKLIGRMQFIMKPLLDVLPCLGAIQYSFVNDPVLELDFTGLANVADFGGIDKLIRGIIKDSIKSIMVLPKRMTAKIDPGCDVRDALVKPVGIARITAKSGRGFVIEKRVGLKDDIPDAYLNVKLGDQLWKTSVQKDNLSPVWNETADFMLSDRDQILDVHAWDEDTGRFDSDDDLGKASLTIADILRNGKQMEVELQDGHNIGTGAFVTLHCDVVKLKVDPKGFDIPAPLNHLNGVLIIIVTKAFDLPLSKKEAESFVKVKYGSQEFETGMVVDYPGIDCLNPDYDMTFQVPITREIAEKNYSDIEFELWNGIKKPYKLGSIKIPHMTLLAAPENTITETRSVIGDGPMLEFKVSLLATDRFHRKSVLSTLTKGLNHKPTSESITESKNELTPLIEANQLVKKVRITMMGGQGFKVRKRKFHKDDIPDLYCNVKFGTSPKIWRTKTIKNSVCPNWNESQVYHMENEGKIINVEIYDANKKGDDTFVGSFRVEVGRVLLSSGEKELELKNQGAIVPGSVTVLCELE